MPETRPRGFADQFGTGRTGTAGRASTGEGLAPKVERIAANMAAQGNAAVDAAISRPDELRPAPAGASGLANGQSFDVDVDDGHLWHVDLRTTWHGVDTEHDFGVEAGSGVIPDGRPRPTLMQLSTRVIFGGALVPPDQRPGGRLYGSDSAYVYGITGIAWSSFRVRCLAIAPSGFPDITYDVSVELVWLRRLYDDL